MTGAVIIAPSRTRKKHAPGPSDTFPRSLSMIGWPAYPFVRASITASRALW